jgi:ABC-2 type transport system permease protein
MLMAGAYLGICSLTSAFTKNQVISFVISVFLCFILVLLGWSVFTDFLGGYLALPAWLGDAVSNFSFKSHFDGFVKGIIDPKDVIFFLSLAGFCLFLNVLVLER